MDIGVTNIYASTYAMKKAIDMPKLMLNLVQQIPSTDGSLNTESPDVKHMISVNYNSHRTTIKFLGT